MVPWFVHFRTVIRHCSIEFLFYDCLTGAFFQFPFYKYVLFHLHVEKRWIAVPIVLVSVSDKCFRVEELSMFFFIPNTRYKAGILVWSADIFASYAVFSNEEVSLFKEVIE